MKSLLGLSPRVLHYIQKQALLPPGETVLVGVSGGPDSVCLVHLLAGFQDRLGVRLHVAHLNHGLRGANSEADAAYVSNLAQALGLPCTVEVRDVAAYRAQRHLSLEAAARQVRYAFFSQVAGAVGASRVAVGHTADDQVETILLHLVRGAGLRGLQGMAPLSPWPGQEAAGLGVVRPLLEVSRQETMAYCQEQGLAPRMDASNYSPAYLRNRLRRLLPRLESLNPAVRQALLRLGKAASEAVAFLDAEVAKAWPQVVVEERACPVRLVRLADSDTSFGRRPSRRGRWPIGAYRSAPGRGEPGEGEASLALDKGELSRLPAAVQRHLLLAAWGRLRGNPQDLEAVHIEEMLAALARPVGTRLNLPGGLVFWVDYDQVSLATRYPGAEACPFPPLVGEFSLQIPGETAFPGWQVVAKLVPRGEEPPPSPETGQRRDKTLAVCMDFHLAGPKLWVRSRRPGDRFQPLGLSQEKKLQDFMVDAKIPRVWRDRVPLVGSPWGVLWVVGYRLAESVKLTERSQQVLCLEFSRR